MKVKEAGRRRRLILQVPTGSSKIHQRAFIERTLILRHSKKEFGEAGSFPGFRIQNTLETDFIGFWPFGKNVIMKQ